MKPFTDEELRLYISEKADANLRNDIEQAIAVDTELVERIAFMRDLALGYETRELKKTLLAINSNPARATREEPPKKVPSIYTWIGVAAMIVLLIGFWSSGFKNNASSSTNYLSEYLVAPPGLPTPMGNPNDQYDFLDAMVSYKIKEYEIAESKWSAQLTANSSDTLQYYLGAANFCMYKYEQAASYFNRVHENKNSTFYNSSTWHLALIKLKMNQIEEAKIYLQQCSHPKKEALLKKIP